MEFAFPKASEAERVSIPVFLPMLPPSDCDCQGEHFRYSLSIDMSTTSSIMATSPSPGIISASTTPPSTPPPVAFIPLILPLLLPIGLLPQPLLLRLNLLRRLLDLDRRLWQILREPRVRTLLALPPVRAEARKVELAQRPPHVLLAAPLTQGTEALFVMWAGREPCRRVDVQVVAVVPADAVAAAVVIRAFRPGADVVLVQVVALVALFAEAFEPVLADEVVVVVVAVFVGAEVAEGAEALAVRLANWSIGVEAEAVFAFEKVGEGEVVGWEGLKVGGVLIVDVHRGRSAVIDCGGHGVWGRCKRVDVGDLGERVYCRPE